MSKQIKVYNIVFIQSSDDIQSMYEALSVNDLDELNDKQIIEYLKQWVDSNLENHDSNLYDILHLDSEYLGYRLDKRTKKSGFLFSRNDSLNYVGLSYYTQI